MNRQCHPRALDAAPDHDPTRRDPAVNAVAAAVEMRLPRRMAGPQDLSLSHSTLDLGQLKAPFCRSFGWARLGSNQRPLACEAIALS